MKFVEKNKLYMRDVDYNNLSQDEHTIECENTIMDCLIKLRDNANHSDTDLLYTINTKIDMCIRGINEVKEKYATRWKSVTSAYYQRDCMCCLNHNKEEKLTIC